MVLKHIRFRLLLLLSGIALFVPFYILANAGAVSQLVAQGYTSSSNLQPGMIVRLDSLSSGQVTALDLNHINQMLGVIISASDSALTLSQTNASQQAVYVSNFGQHNVLVTNQNGPIKTGDFITISALSGVGMKADNNETLVLGRAAAGFDGIHNVISTDTLSSSNGQKLNLSIGIIPVNINIEPNPLAQGTRGVPAFINKLTKYATNKSVSASRIYLGMLCVVAGLIITITIVYSGIRNGFISIGRNPLAKRAIAVNLIRVVAIAIVIFATSIGAAYAIITTQ